MAGIRRLSIEGCLGSRGGYTGCGAESTRSLIALATVIAFDAENCRGCVLRLPQAVATLAVGGATEAGTPVVALVAGRAELATAEAFRLPADLRVLAGSIGGWCAQS